MCQNNIGVVAKIDVEHISKEMADFIKVLDKEVKDGKVEIHVDKVKKITKGLENIIKPQG